MFYFWLKPNVVCCWQQSCKKQPLVLKQEQITKKQTNQTQLILYLYKMQNLTNNNPSSQTPVILPNLLEAASPGVYEIVCKANGKRYIGESENVLDRLGKHSRALIAGKGECAALQEDWNNFTQTQFEARVLVNGPEWADQKKRLSKEREFILNYQPYARSAEVYNYARSAHPLQTKQPKRNTRVICGLRPKN
jgi:hypothetical protein